MKKLIIARHGNYDSKTGDLTKTGEWQIKKLTAFINKLNGDYKCRYSHAIRAKQSMDNLTKNLNYGQPVGIDVWNELFDEKDYLTLYKAKGIHEKVKKIENEADNLILVSHFSVATGYSTYFMQKEFGKIMPVENVPKGKAVLIDIANKDWDIIPN